MINLELNPDARFSHTYMERFWPKYAGLYSDKELLDPRYNGGLYNPNTGIRYEFGDFNDLVKLFNSNSTTRQGYLPIWFPERYW